MEIHASSLNFTALKLNPQKSGESNAVQNRGEKNQDDAKKLIQATKAVSQTSEEIEQIMANAGLSENTSSKAIPNDQPATIRLAKAVNAYTTTLNQPLLDHRAQLVAGIDFYV